MRSSFARLAVPVRSFSASSLLGIVGETPAATLPAPAPRFPIPAAPRRSQILAARPPIPAPRLAVPTSRGALATFALLPLFTLRLAIFAARSPFDRPRVMALFAARFLVSARIPFAFALVIAAPGAARRTFPTSRAGTRAPRSRSVPISIFSFLVRFVSVAFPDFSVSVFFLLEGIKR